MTEKTDIIIEVFVETGAILNKRGVVINAEARGDDVSYSTVKRHIKQLVEEDFLEIYVEEGAWYRITEKGEKFYSGELDTEDISNAGAD